MAFNGYSDGYSRDMTRRDYGAGSVYQRKSDGLWVGAITDGWTASGTRRRYTVTAKTEAQVKRKLRDKKDALRRGEVGTSPRPATCNEIV